MFPKMTKKNICSCAVVISLLVLCVVLFLFKDNIFPKNVVNETERFENNCPQVPQCETTSKNVTASDSVNTTFAEVKGESKPNTLPSDCFPKDQLSPCELLPTDNASKWAEVNPNGDASLCQQNFLVADHHVGVNTVGQALRNANRQIRSEPANPQVKVSPWLNTTIGPDLARRPLEIGENCTNYENNNNLE